MATAVESIGLTTNWTRFIVDAAERLATLSRIQKAMARFFWVRIEFGSMRDTWIAALPRAHIG
jgi:hypothetical protein